MPRWSSTPSVSQEEDDDEYEDDVEEEEEEDGAGEDDIIPMDEVSFEVAVMKANSDKALV
jgi:hypothetical protein